MKDDADDRKRDNPWPSSNSPYQGEPEHDAKLWGIFLFGLIGATATTFAMSRSQSPWKGGAGSFRSSFQEEAWKRYNKRLQEEYEEEMARVERIRRMQSVFNRERNKYKRSYENWSQNDHNGGYRQHFQRDDWYWKTDASYRDWRTNYREAPRETGSYSLSHHYSVLGLDRFRTTPYTDAEIKTAFRTKAKEYHPDQNQDNREAAEAKFKEVVNSYETIKKERENQM
ncbi:dnaJ homolog subfamily C member 7 homolog [Neltuma alba]|uniref:dnaJ homolog subfamily C member 7 homolog n=1 Tax=Neltuma alba TaxID=207710 RepID=UPI0010A56B4F|nr:dnaJ homolog subfamily C member 7 homolog [Prosopis alba]XP_028806973.1 dnaJ homolog subfamily C member 7 homolog [Prosopis alba]